MKKYVLILSVLVVALLFDQQAKACSCMSRENEPLSARISSFDFIAHIKVRSVRVRDFTNPQQMDASTDFARIEIVELFKGNKVDSLHIWGIGTSCDMSVRAGDEWLIWGTREGDHYTTGMCTGSSRINYAYDVRPFFDKELYQLQLYFNHSLPAMKNGTHQQWLPDGRLQSRYAVKKRRIQGEVYFRNDHNIYFYQFAKGRPDGTNYMLVPRSESLYKTVYRDGTLVERTVYDIGEIADTAIYTDRIKLEQLAQHQRKLKSQAIALTNGGQSTKTWFDDGTIQMVQEIDKNGAGIFTAYYFSSGMLRSSKTQDASGQVSTSLFYYENGIIQRRQINGPGSRREVYYYNENGTLKESETEKL